MRYNLTFVLLTHSRCHHVINVYNACRLGALFSQMCRYPTDTVDKNIDFFRFFVFSPPLKIPVTLIVFGPTVKATPTVVEGRIHL